MHMNILKLLFLIFPLSSFIHITTSVNCPPPSFCGNLSIPIRYPFQLTNNDNPQQKSNNNYCSYPPGYSLTCNPQSSTLILKLPYSRDFYVKNISYLDRKIYISDPNNCLPKRLLAENVSLLSSPFRAFYYEDYSFFSCPPNISQYGYTSVPCLSNSSFYVVAVTSSYSSLMHSLFNCSNVSWTLSGVPRVKFDSDRSFETLFDEIILTWGSTYYSTCECCDDVDDNGGICVYRPYTTPASQGSQSFMTIGLAIFIPLLILALVILTIVRWKRRSSGGGTESQETTTTTLQDLTAAQAPSTAVIGGLDDSIIELCSVKLIIGEGFDEFIGNEYNSNICAICLSDFSPNEAIRWIVECQHYFHADCIDEWLRMKGMCPVCRNNLLL